MESHRCLAIEKEYYFKKPNSSTKYVSGHGSSGSLVFSAVTPRYFIPYPAPSQTHY